MVYWLNKPFWAIDELISLWHVKKNNEKMSSPSCGLRIAYFVPPTVLNQRHSRCNDAKQRKAANLHIWEPGGIFNFMYHKMQYVTERRWLLCCCSPDCLALWLREHSACPLDVATLNSSVCIHDDTDISQAFNTEVTTGMWLGFCNMQYVQSGGLHVLMRFPDLLRVKYLLGLRRSGLNRSHMRWFELLLQQNQHRGMELLE